MSMLKFIIENFKERLYKNLDNSIDNNNNNNIISNINNSPEKIKYINKEIKLFLEKKSDRGYTALQFAAFRGNINTLRYMIKLRACIDAKNNQGTNVFHSSSQGNQPISLIYLLSLKNWDITYLAKKDNRMCTCLHWAVFMGCKESVTYILSFLSNDNIFKNITSPQLNHDNSEHSSSLNSHLIFNNQNINYNEAYIQLTKYEIINSKDSNGQTPLHLACIKGWITIAQMLIRHGARVDMQDKEGMTPFDIAKTNNFGRIQELFLKD